MKPVLDGQPVDPAVIDPAKHRYVGMWREPNIPSLVLPILCHCGQHISLREIYHQHYRGGCFDVPQYESIERAPEKIAESLKTWDEIKRRYYAGEYGTPKPVRLRIPASEVKAGDVFVNSECNLHSVLKVEHIVRFDITGGFTRSYRADELVEVERANG